MNYFRPLAVSIAALIPFVTPLLAPSSARGQTWDINGAGNWGNPESWNPNTVPNSDTASVFFPSTVGSVYDVFLQGNTYTVNQLTFQGGGFARYRIYNGTVAMAGTNAAINVGPIGSDDFFTAIFVPGSNLALNTAVTVNTSDPASVLLFEPSSSITGTGSLVKTGPGLLQIEGANTYTGGTTLSGGMTQISNGAALGTGSITFGGVEPAQLRSVADITVSNPSITVEANAGGAISAAAGTTLTLQPTEGIDLGNNAALLFGNVGDTGTVVVTGAAGNVDVTSRLIVATGTLRAGTGDASIQAITSNAGMTMVLGGATLDFNDQGNPSNGNLITVRNLVGDGTVHIGNNAATVMELNAGNFAGAITGAGGVDIAGTVALSGASTYSGGTSLTSGSLTVGNNSALGTGTLTVQGGTTLTLTNGVSIANNVTVQGDFTFSTNGDATIAGNIDLGNATRTITVSSSEVTLSGVISGSGGLTLTGGDGPSGSILISGTSGNTYTGLTTLDTGGNLVGLAKESGFALPGGLTVKSGSGVAFMHPNQQVSGTVTLESESGAIIFLSQTIDDLQGSGMIMMGLVPMEGEDTPLPVLTIRAGDFSGTVMQGESSSTLVKDGPGTLNFTGTSTHTGGTIIRGGGTLAVNSDAALGAAESDLAVEGSRLSFLAGFDTGRAVTVSGAAEFDTGAFTSELSGVISGTGTLVKTGTGTLNLSGVNTYTGGTALNGGTLAVGNNNALGDGALTIEGGTTLELADGVSIANNVVVNGDFILKSAPLTATEAITGNINLGNATRTITMTPDSVVSFSGVISGNGGLTVGGTDGSYFRLILEGESGNTYSGVTTVGSGGGLSLNKTAGFAAPNGLLIQSGADVSIRHVNQQVRGTVALQEEAALDIFTSQTIDDLQGAGEIQLFAETPTEFIVRAGNSSATITQYAPSGPAITFIKEGNGRLNFTGTSNHTGGTIIRGLGTLAVNSDAALGAAGGGISIDNARLGFLDSFDTSRPITINSFGGFETNGSVNTLSGVISGSGYVYKTGDGTLRLTGTNTYTGGTVIENGVLEISSDANLGAASGQLSFQGATLRLLGNLISARSGAIIGGEATIDTNGFNATLSGDFGGLDGSLRKVGAGTLTLNGEISFMGNTYVQEGTLILNGLVERDVIVGQGSPGPAVAAVAVVAQPVFGGSGRVSGNLFNEGGIIAPGNSPGTLTVDGNFSQSAGGTLQIEIAGRSTSQYDRLLIGGTANLDGTVQFIALDGFRPRGGDRFVFLTAEGGLNNTTFSTVLLDAPLIAGRVDYTATTATLSFARRPIAPIFNGGGGDEDEEIIIVDAPDLPRLSGNQTAVAQVLDDAITDERLNRTFDELDRYSLQGIPGALDLIAPEELSAIYEIGIGSARVQAFNLDRHLSDLRLGRSGFSGDRFRLDAVAERSGKNVLTPDGKTEVSGKDVFTPGPDNRWSVFLSGSGEFLDIDGDANARGYDITTSGFTLGADYRVCEGFAVGILAGYAGTGTELAGDGHILVNSGKLGIYATGFNENWYVNALAAGGYNSYDIKRRGLGGTTRGDTDGGEFTGLLAAGYDVHSGAVTWGPFAEVQYTYVGYDGFEERGSAAPLDIQSNDSESLRTRLGARFAYQYQAGRVGIRPELRVGWQHEYLDQTRPTDSRFASGAGDIFRVEGPEVGRDSLIVNASVTFLCGERFSTYLSYDGELGRNRYESHTVSGGVGIGF